MVIAALKKNTQYGTESWKNIKSQRKTHIYLSTSDRIKECYIQEEGKIG